MNGFFWTFGGKKSPELSELPSTCPQLHFEGHDLGSVFFFSFGHPAKNLGCWLKEFRKIVTTASFVARGVF